MHIYYPMCNFQNGIDGNAVLLAKIFTARARHWWSSCKTWFTATCLNTCRQYRGHNWFRITSEVPHALLTCHRSWTGTFYMCGLTNTWIQQSTWVRNSKTRTCQRTWVGIGLHWTPETPVETGLGQIGIKPATLDGALAVNVAPACTEPPNTTAGETEKAFEPGICPVQALVGGANLESSTKEGWRSQSASW